MHTLLKSAPQPLWFNTLFSAVESAASLWQRPLCVTPNQQVEVAQALRHSGTEFLFSDIDFYGLQCAAAEGYAVMATDYAGVMPALSCDIQLWTSGAGFLDREPSSEITIVDLKSLDPGAPVSGALVWCKDSLLTERMARFSALGIEPAVAWNDRVASAGIAGMMEPLVREYWETHLDTLVQQLGLRTEVANIYAEALSGSKLLDLLPTDAPRFFPVKLIPELYCPKEEIYLALREAGVDVTVPFKPLFKYQAFETENLLRASEFYKAVMALPTHGISCDEASETARIFLEVLERYSYRSCSF